MQMELGGNNPLLVLNDVDVVQSAEIAAEGGVSRRQICMSGARIIVEAPLARPFAEALARKADSLYLGDLRDERTAYGPLINQASLDKAAAHGGSCK